MHFLAVSLLTVLAGTLMLAKFRKEKQGRFFIFISWFFIVVGFILFVFCGIFSISRITHRGRPGYPGFRNEWMSPGIHRNFMPPSAFRHDAFRDRQPDRGRIDSLRKNRPVPRP
jgi:hypothetical protein